MGQSPPSSTYRESPDGLPFFQGKAEFGFLHPTPRVWCVEPKKIAQPGDILISVRAPVGPTNVADVECCIGRGLAAIRARSHMSQDFLWHALRRVESAVAADGTGSTFKSISGKRLRAVEIPVPPLDEQTRIVEQLNSQLDATKRAQQAAETQLEALEALPSALLREVFPRSRSARLPHGWQWVRLADVLARSDSGVWGDDDPVHGVNVLRSTNFAEHGVLSLQNVAKRMIPVEKLSEKALAPGDIILERSGGGPKQPVGRVCKYDGSTETYYFGNFCQRLRADSTQCESSYLFEYLHWFHLSGSTGPMQNRTTGIRNLRYKDYIAQDIPLPPLPIQRGLVERIRSERAIYMRARRSAQSRLGVAEALSLALLRLALPA